MSGSLSPRALLAGLALFVLPLPAAAQDAKKDEIPALAWPRQWKTDAGTIELHQPQMIAWNEYLALEARAAVAVTPAGDTEPTWAVVEIAAKTMSDTESGEVTV